MLAECRLLFVQYYYVYISFIIIERVGGRLRRRRVYTKEAAADVAQYNAL